MTSPLPVLPQIIVEAGFTAGAAAGGALNLLLGSSTQGLLGTDTLGNVATWTDITQWVVNFAVTRASTRAQGPLYTYQASTATVLLDNTDGRFDPDNLAGPYVVAGATQVQPMLPIRISAVFGGVTYRLFTGFADGWTETPVTYEGGYAEVTVAATDGFKMLAGVTLASQASPVGAADTTDGRVNRILTAASWYTDHRTLQAGVETGLQGSTYGTSALSLMQLAADAEVGQLYIDGNGVLQFRNRRALMGADSRSRFAQGVFSDTPAVAGAVSSVTAQCWGSGGGGSGNLTADAKSGSGGGGGEFAQDTVAVTPGNTYTVVVGAGGAAGGAAGGNGAAGASSTFAGDSVTVTAHGGGGGTDQGAGGAGGTGSSNATHFGGGAGAAGSSTSRGSIVAGQLSSVMTSQNGGTVTWPVNPAAGQKVLVGIACNTFQTISSVVDNGTTPSTFTLDATSSANGQQFLIYRADGITLPSAGSYQVTISGSGNRFVFAVGRAYSGVALGAPTATQTGSNAGSAAVSTGTATPAAAGALFFAGFGDGSSATETITLTGAGFGSLGSAVTGATVHCSAAADKIDAAGPTATACTWTLSDTPAWSAAIAVYDAAVASAAPAGGGGSSAGTAAAGNPGGFPAGGAAPAGGGTGGAGGASPLNPGVIGGAPGGGGGGGDAGALGNEPGGAGAAGQVVLTWAGGTQTFAVPGTYQWTAGPPLAYSAIGRANDDTQLANDIQVTVVGSSNLQEAQDAASEAAFIFPRTYARSDLPLVSDADGLIWAQGVLYLSKTGADRFDTLAVDPQADASNLWPQVLAREIGDRIQVWKQPPGVAAFSKDAFIAGIAHAFDFTTLAWLTTWTLQDASRYSTFLILGDTGRGVLGTNVLAF